MRSSTALARPVLSAGWLAKGLLFVIIGTLAIEIARSGYATERADQRGALAALAEAPAGRILVLAVSVGLLLYASWQAWTAVVDDGTKPIDIAKRIGWVGLAIVYALLAETGLRIALGGASRSSDSAGGPTSPSGLTRRLLEVPGGRYLIVLIGVGVGVVAAYHLWKGISGDYLDDIATDTTGRLHRLGLRIAGAVGFVARASVLAIAGWLFLDAGWSFRPDRAAGMDESLRALSTAPLGQLLLVVTGFGLSTAGLYDMVTFRRQRIDDSG